MNKLKKLIRDVLGNRELVMYIVFGVLTTIVSFASYYAARWVFKGANTAPAVMTSWVCAVTFAYISNSLWVFESPATSLLGVMKELALFYASRFFTLGVDMLLTFLLVDLTGISGGLYELGVRVFVAVIVTTLNYVLSKLIVFRKKSG